MLNQNDKIELFAQEINKNADKIVKKIERQTEKFREQQLSAFEAQARADYESRVAYEAQRIKTEMNREIGALRADEKRAAAQYRNQIVDDVFAAATEKLRAFTLTDAYHATLENSIRRLADSMEGNVTIFVRDCDLDAAKAICADLPCVTAVLADSEISLGLAKAANEARTVFADDTLEQRLVQYRETFLEHSGLLLED